MKKKILMSLFTIAIVGALIGGGVMAVFTDTEGSNPNYFRSGTLDITLGNPSGTWSTGFNNMQPGDAVTFTLSVTSTGTLPLNYTVVTALSGNLAPVCSVTHVWMDRAADNSPTPNTGGRLSAAGQGDAVDDIVIRVLMANVGNNWQNLRGNLSVTVNATQQ